MKPGSSTTDTRASYSDVTMPAKLGPLTGMLYQYSFSTRDFRGISEKLNSEIVDSLRGGVLCMVAPMSRSIPQELLSGQLHWSRF